MKVLEVYKKFNIPPNLAGHMLTVAKAVVFIQEHWIGPKLNWNKVVQAALLHDLGNIVKFDMDKYPELMGKEQGRIDYWKKVQKEIIEKYGKNDHEATKKMLKELKVEKDVVEDILEKSFGNSITTVVNDDWNSKILLYADLRIVPSGLVSLEERIEDVKNRMPQYTERKDFPQIVETIRTLEKQIQKNLNIPPLEITNEAIQKNKIDLLNTTIQIFNK